MVQQEKRVKQGKRVQQGGEGATGEEDAVHKYLINKCPWLWPISKGFGHRSCC